MLKYNTSERNLRTKKEKYEKIWKDKEFIFEVGPIKSEEAKDISKGKTEEIVLPD